MLIILITSIIYLVKIDDIKLSISKFWYAIAGYICLTSIAMTLSIVSFNGNYSEITYASTLYKIGIKISFPWHLLITIPIFLIISFGIYYLFTLIFKNHTEKDSKNNEENKNDFFEIYSFSTKSICCMQGFLILILLSAIVRNPLGTWLGILCLIPLIMTIFCILATIFRYNDLFLMIVTAPVKLQNARRSPGQFPYMTNCRKSLDKPIPVSMQYVHRHRGNSPGLYDWAPSCATTPPRNGRFY